MIADVFYRVTIIGFLRVVAFGHFFWTPNYDFTNTWGPSYSAIEPSLAIIAACIPFMRRMLQQWFPSLFVTTRRTGDMEARPYQQHHNTPEARRNLSQAMQLHDMVSNHAEIETGFNVNGSQEGIMAPLGILKTTKVRPLTSMDLGMHYVQHFSRTDLTDNRWMYIMRQSRRVLRLTFRPTWVLGTPRASSPTGAITYLLYPARGWCSLRCAQ